MNLSGRTISNIDTADNADIRRAITKATPKARIQARRFAKKFDRGTELQTCKAIFDFLKNDLKYVADGDHQVVQLPSALLRNRRGDCKSYSVFTSAVLSNLGIPHYYVYASYTGNPTPGHIYVVTDSGIIIDAVYGHFNKEKAANYKYPTNINGTMRVSTIAGIGCASCPSPGIGSKEDRQRRRRERQLEQEEKKRQKQLEEEQRKLARQACGPQGLKPGTLALGRWLFAAIVQMNMDGFATKMSKMDFAKIKDAWCKVGGNPFSLQEWIKNGSSRREIRIGLLSRIAKKAGVKIGSSIGQAPENMTPQKIKQIENAIPAAGAVVATPIALASGNPEKAAPAIPGFVMVLKELSPLIVDMIIALKGSDMGPDQPIPPFTPPTPPPSGGNGLSATTMLLIAGGMVAAYFVFKK